MTTNPLVATREHSGRLVAQRVTADTALRVLHSFAHIAWRIIRNVLRKRDRE